MKRHSKIIIPIKTIKLIELRKYLFNIWPHNYIKNIIIENKIICKSFALDKIHIFKANLTYEKHKEI